jgi:hypothetical protein
MRNFYINFLIIASLVIVGCQKTTPPPEPTATRIPVSKLNLEKILIVSDDLKPEYYGSQIQLIPDDFILSQYDISKQYGYFVGQVIDSKTTGGQGGVYVFVYEDTNLQNETYNSITIELNKVHPSDSNKTIKNIDSIGEASIVSHYSVSLLGTSIITELVFKRCNAVVFIRMGGDTIEDDWIQYASRLDKRLSEYVC